MAPALRVASIAAGGAGVSRLPDGRAVFIPRSAPGDLVELGRVREHRNWAEADLARVIEPAPSTAEHKIAAIGIRIRRGVSFHGISLNVTPDLSHYDGIVPCGIAEHGVTSLASLGRTTAMKDVDMSLKLAFERVFGPAIEGDPPQIAMAAATAR